MKNLLLLFILFLAAQGCKKNDCLKCSQQYGVGPFYEVCPSDSMYDRAKTGRVAVEVKDKQGRSVFVACY